MTAVLNISTPQLITHKRSIPATIPKFSNIRDAWLKHSTCDLSPTPDRHWLIVGLNKMVYDDSLVSDANIKGRVFVYFRNPTTDEYDYHSEIVYRLSDDAALVDFGAGTRIYGNSTGTAATAVVVDSNKKIYIFEYSGGLWTFSAKFENYAASMTYDAGKGNVAVGRLDMICIGQPLFLDPIAGYLSTGRVYTLKKVAGTWIETDYLDPADRDGVELGYLNFGRIVCVGTSSEGHTVMCVGAARRYRWYDSYDGYQYQTNGAVYWYKRNALDTGWDFVDDYWTTYPYYMNMADPARSFSFDGDVFATCKPSSSCGTYCRVDEIAWFWVYQPNLNRCLMRQYSPKDVVVTPYDNVYMGANHAIDAVGVHKGVFYMLAHYEDATDEIYGENVWGRNYLVAYQLVDNDKYATPQRILGNEIIPSFNEMVYNWNYGPVLIVGGNNVNWVTFGVNGAMNVYGHQNASALTSSNYFGEHYHMQGVGIPNYENIPKVITNVKNHPMRCPPYATQNANYSNKEGTNNGDEFGSALMISPYGNLLVESRYHDFTIDGNSYHQDNGVVFIYNEQSDKSWTMQGTNFPKDAYHFVCFSTNTCASSSMALRNFLTFERTEKYMWFRTTWGSSGCTAYTFVGSRSQIDGPAAHPYALDSTLYNNRYPQYVPAGKVPFSSSDHHFLSFDPTTTPPTGTVFSLSDVRGNAKITATTYGIKHATNLDVYNVDDYGHSCIVNNTFVLVTARLHTWNANYTVQLTNAGAVFLYQWTATYSKWETIQKLLPTTRSANMYFGHSISISGLWLAVGAYGDPLDKDDLNSVSGAGAVHIFTRTALGYYNIAYKITSPARVTNGYFGYQVLFAGNLLCITEYGTKKVHIYRLGATGALRIYTYTGNATGELSGDLTVESLAALFPSNNINTGSLFIGLPKATINTAAGTSSCGAVERLPISYRRTDLSFLTMLL